MPGEYVLKDPFLLGAYSNNSRTHTPEQVQQICNSIKEFGFTNPVLIDQYDGIIAGHCRVEAAKKLDIQKIPCIVLSHLSNTQKKAYIIADNKLALNADWDFKILQEEFQALIDDDFNLELLGFDIDEIAELMPPPEPEIFSGDDDCPTEASEPRTKTGDVWLLGNHRLMCGDSTQINDVDKLLNGLKPNLMVTDPPYGVKYEADWRAEAKNRKKTSREENSNLKNDDIADWYDAYILFPGSVAYVWHASSFADVVMDGLRRSGFEIKQQIIWNKNVHALSRSDYHWKHEPCWYAVKDMKRRDWKGGRKQMSVWEVASVMNEKDKTAHPTQKPVELFVRSIENHTHQNEYIYDPFAGSGTCIIAAEKTIRRTLAMELDPKYCDIIIERWENYTNKKATLEVQNA